MAVKKRKSRRKHDFSENVKKNKAGRLYDTETGRLVPKNWKKLIAARYYGAMTLQSTKHHRAADTIALRYNVDVDRTREGMKNWLRSLGDYYNAGMKGEEMTYEDMLESLEE